MTDQARAAYVEKVLTEEQHTKLLRIREMLSHPEIQDYVWSKGSAGDVLAIIDTLIVHGVECEGKLAKMHEAANLLGDMRVEAEARLTAVREELRHHQEQLGFCSCRKCTRAALTERT
jgi:hypothetical protein